MAQEPFIEIKLDTDAFHFIQELFRLSEAFRQSSPLQIDKVWVRVHGIGLYGRPVPHQYPDISDFSRTDIKALTSSDDSLWTLFFNTFQHETFWKVYFEVELRRIGGSHPLLVRFISCLYDLEPFLADVLTRCGSWWDAQIVSFETNSPHWRSIFRNIDVRKSPFLSNLERRCYGKGYDRWAPSALRTARELAEQDNFGDEDDSIEGEADEYTSVESSNVTGPEKPPFAQEAAPNDSAAGQPEPPSGDIGPEQDAPSRMYGPTEVKIAEVRELLAQKRRGSHRGKPWSWAIAKAPWTQEHGPLDLKTAQKHLAAERTE